MLLNTTSNPLNQKVGMPFTMNFASTPSVMAQDVVDDMDYNPKRQVNTINSSILVAGSKSSTCSKQSATTSGGIIFGKDKDTDTQQDD